MFISGYISDEAKANIKRVVDTLGVDHVYGTTEYMNEIFVDSLKRSVVKPPVAAK